MGEYAAAKHTALNSVQALGRGFDVNFDTRLLYCKGVAGSRVVEVDEKHSRDLFLYDDIVLPNVSRDIKNSQDSVGRQSSGVCSFNEVSLHVSAPFSDFLVMLVSRFIAFGLLVEFLYHQFNVQLASFDFGLWRI